MPAVIDVVHDNLPSSARRRRPDSQRIASADPITSDAASRICPSSQQGDDHELLRA
jgi:hypothetical protein